MDFSVPHKNASDLLLYIWKIIEIPSISINDLIFKISFEFFILPPNKAKNFVNLAMKNNLLTRINNNNLVLSNNLINKFQEWQKNRKDEILKKLYSYQKESRLLKKNFQDKNSNFSTLLKAFTEKNILNRTVSISNDAIISKSFNFKEGILKVTFAGSQKESYIIEINMNKKVIKHNCHDFIARRAQNKQFCKHIAKLFLFLKKENMMFTIKLLKEIAENINQWDFIID
ncbi:MAG: hypothetical protein ACTSQJ_10120 [Promethearchaeota archaeon]